MSEERPAKRSRLSLPWWISAGWLVLMFGLYMVRPGITTAITVWPAWIGLLIGLLFTARSRCNRKPLFAAWLLFGWVFVDEFRSVPRGVLPEPTRDFRVVTLNCAGGSLLAAEEVIALKPDLVLFQESPSRHHLEEVALKLFGPRPGIVWGPDASIIARGGLTERALPKGTSNFVAATWTPEKGRSIEVASLRLTPPVLRIDLYDPSAWSDFARNRELRASEVKEMAAAHAGMRFHPDLVGGDFNTPPDDGVQGPLVQGMRDAYASAGMGLGATCVNPMPCVVRIDQVWSGPKIKPVRARVIKTEHSDHRMVVADYVWQ